MAIDMPSDIAPTASKGVDRRTLLKAGVWAAPVLVLTTAAPAAASSLGVISASGSRVREGQSSRFRINATFTSSYSIAKSLTRVAALDVLPAGVTFASGPTTPITVNANGTTSFSPLATITGAAPGQTITFGYTFSTGGSPVTETVLVSVIL